jgi:transposase InsO family protein
VRTTPAVRREIARSPEPTAVLARRFGVQHHKIRPYTTQTNGLIERFNGCVQREVIGITIYSHRDLETLLKGFNQTYNRRQQRVLKGASPSR